MSHLVPPLLLGIGPDFLDTAVLAAKAAIDIVASAHKIWCPVTVRRAKKGRVHNHLATKKAGTSLGVRRNEQGCFVSSLQLAMLLDFSAALPTTLHCEASTSGMTGAQTASAAQLFGRPVDAVVRPHSLHLVD